MYISITTECRGVIVTNESRNTNNQLQCIPEHVEKLLIFYVINLKKYTQMENLTKQQALDMLIDNNYRSIKITVTVDCDGEKEEITWAYGYVDKSNKDIPKWFNKKYLDMYDDQIVYLVKENFVRC